MARVSLTFLLFASQLLLSCASRLSSAVGAFEAGRLSDAANEFRELEPDFVRLGAHERARYALYTGLTQLALGDLVRAERWLLPLNAAVMRCPSMLDDTERGALFAALRSTGRLPGE